MSRYRWSNNPTEETATVNGDQSFVGIDQKTPDPALMARGMLRVSENARIIQGVPQTRGGAIAALSINPVSFGRIWGRGFFADPNSVRWMLLATSSGVWAVADGYEAAFIPLPTFTTISTPCELVTAFNVVMLFRGPTLAPLFWDGDFTSSFGNLPSPTDVTKSTSPNASTGEFLSDRLVVPYGKDAVSISDIGDYTSFTLTNTGFEINQGDADSLVRVFPWLNNSVIMFKDHSIYLTQNVTGNLSSLSITQVVDGLGLVGRKAAVIVGNEVFYVDRGGINKITQVFENTPETRALPMSEPIKPIIDNINWALASGIVAAWRRDRVYFAVPLGAMSTRNNALLVWNITNAAWESVDTFQNPVFGVDDLVLMDYNGDRRLVAIDEINGQLVLLEEGSSDNFTRTSEGTQQIQFHIRTRGYSGPGKRNSYRRFGISLATWAPNYSININMDGVGRTSLIAAGVTKSRTKYYTFDRKPWNTTNVNDDWDTPGRQDYSVTSQNPGIFLKEGIVVDQRQEFWDNYLIDRPGKYCQLDFLNTHGVTEIRGIIFEEVEAQRADRTQV